MATLNVSTHCLLLWFYLWIFCGFISHNQVDMLYLIEADFFIDFGLTVFARCFLFVPMGPHINAALLNVTQSFCLKSWWRWLQDWYVNTDCSLTLPVYCDCALLWCSRQCLFVGRHTCHSCGQSLCCRHSCGCCLRFRSGSHTELRLIIGVSCLNQHLLEVRHCTHGICVVQLLQTAQKGRYI